MYNECPYCGTGAVDDMMVLLGYEPATDEPREAKKEEK